MTSLGLGSPPPTPASSRQINGFLDGTSSTPHGLGTRSKTQERLDEILQRDNISCFRRIAAGILRNQWFNMFISSIILFNIVIMIIDANFLGECVLAGTEACELEEHPWTGTAEFVFLGIYTSELLLRLVAERRGFFQSSWNNMDCLVVLAGIVEIALSFLLAGNMLGLLQVLKLLRVARILRATRLLRFFPQLFTMVQGFIHAFVAMGWGLVMILILLVMISIVAVELIAPQNVEQDTEWCVEAFGSVWTATLLFFQITVAGDSWGACAIPLMREHFYTSVVFVGAVCTVELGFMNLILSAIIQTAQEAQENDMQEKKNHVLQKKQQSAAELMTIFRQIDRDDSGTLSYDELLAAYNDRNGKANSILTVLDVSKNDLPELFQLMDMDGSDHVGHKEFVECIRKAQVQDMRIQMLTMKLQLDRISRSIGKEVRKAVKSCLLEKGPINVANMVSTASAMYDNAAEERQDPKRSWSEKAVLDPPSKEEKLRETDKDAFLPRSPPPRQRQGADELPQNPSEFGASRGVPRQARVAVGEQRRGRNGNVIAAEPLSPGRLQARPVRVSLQDPSPSAPAASLPKCASHWQQTMQESASSVPKQAALKEQFLQLREFKAAMRMEPDRAQHFPP